MFVYYIKMKSNNLKLEIKLKLIGRRGLFSAHTEH